MLKFLLLLSLMIIGMLPDAFSRPYFQQKVNYSIDVTLNDITHELTAFEHLEYTNNSPDTLQFIYFHLWPNAYSGNRTDLANQLFTTKGKERLFDESALRGSMDSLNFKVALEPVQWHLLPNQPDICKLILNTPLFPGKTIHISTPFHVKIPKGVTSRLGHIGQSYQISQWFPKPAVYDNTGWHQMPYLDQGEFYSEFGSFDVRITLPQNYVVGASGELQNESEKTWLDSLASDTIWMKKAKYGRVNFPVSSVQTKSVRYIQNNIHDFAWFADKRFHVLKSKVILPRSGKEITTWLMFTNQQSALWKQAIPFINNAMLDFSDWIGDYPYSSFTAVQSALNAGMGMEYPGITVIGLTKDAYSLDKVIAHEACHNWFYGALASNERRFPFMDEGMTTSYEMRYMAKNYPDKKLWENYFPKLKMARFFQMDKVPMERKMEIEWLSAARVNLEQPANLTSTDFNVPNYYLMLYNKSAISFNYLRAYLGDSMYDHVLKKYYSEWRFKHPQPVDLRNVFELESGKNLSWFFDDLIGSNKRLDYKMVEFKNQRLLVRNVGELASPLLIAGLVGDSVCYEKWEEGFKGEKWINIPECNFTSFQIDPMHLMPELYRLNNNIRTSGIFPKASPVQPQLLFGLADTEKHGVMYIPAVSWNHENGFMLGMVLHNGFIIPKPLEYLVLPFYTFQTSRMAGYGKIAYNFTPYNSFIRLAKVSLEGTQFGAPGNMDYQKIQAGVDIQFRPTEFINPIRQKIFGRFILASDLFQIEVPENATMNSYFQMGYQVQKISLINPYDLKVAFESGKNFQKVSLEGTQFGAPGNMDYQKIQAGVDIQFRPTEFINPIRQKIFGRFILASDLFQIEVPENATMNSYFQMGYQVQKISLINPYDLKVAFESGKNFQKVGLEMNYKLSYFGRNKGLEMRFFGGTMLQNKSLQPYYGIAPAGRSGREQYLYEGMYPDRFGTFPTSLFSRQMTISEGGLVSPINEQLGYSKWLVSISLSSNLPGRIGNIGIKPFVNMLLNDHALNTTHTLPIFAEAGFKVGIWNIFEIHIPLLVTANIQSITGSIQNRIRIVMNLNFDNFDKIYM